MKTAPLSKAIRMAIGASAMAAVAMPAQSQDAAGESAAVEEVYVTGSRIKADGFESVSPVTVVGYEDIKETGYTRIEDVLNSLPSIEAAETSMLSNGASGTATIDLRGLGSNRTLVLVNGRRMQSGGVYSTAPDVNQIPTALVERVEVLTGGASATYGADAVAGVVNFIMRKVDGVELTVGASGFQHNNDNDYIQGLMDQRGFEYPTGSSGIDGKAWNFDLVIGGDIDGGKGNVTVYATFRENQELRQEARDYSSCALNSAGDWCGGSGNAVVPNFYLGVVDANGAMTWAPGEWSYQTINENSEFIDSVGNVYNYAPVNHFMRPDERFNLGAFAEYEFHKNATAYAEVMFMHDSTRAQIAESGTFFAEQYTLDYDSTIINDAQRQYLTDTWGLASGDQFGVYIGKRNVEGGPRANHLEHNAFRIVAGLKGDFSDDWSYDVSYMYGSTASSSAYFNDFFGPRIATAIDPDACAADDECVQYDVFQYQGVTSEAAGSLTGTAILNGRTITQVATAFVSGDTGVAIPTTDYTIQVVAGVEARKESFERTADEVYAKGLLLGQGGPTASLLGEYNVAEMFIESQIPVLDTLSIDVGYRFSDYSSVGETSTYKLGADWEVHETTRIRAGYNRAVRAPNIGELYAQQNLGLWGGSDPCAGDTPEYTEAQCANTGVNAGIYGTITPSPASQYNGLFGGNPDLGPEISDTITAGVVVNPTDSMTFSVDYWDIKLEDVVSTIGARRILDQCATAGANCDLINRPANGSLWLGTAGYVEDTNQNLGLLHYKGVDVAANYTMELGGGDLSFNLLGTYMLLKETVSDPSDAANTTTDCVGNVQSGCFVTPEWRHSLTASYDTGSFWSVSAKWRHFGGVDYLGATDTIASEQLGDAQNYLDLSGSFDVGDYTTVIMGVNNVFDKEPPMVGGTLSTNGNAVAGFYDTLGRFLFVGATMAF